MSPDRGHLHHRLVDRGYSQKQAVVTLYGISGILGLSAIAFFNRDIRFAFLVFLMMGILLYFNVKMMSTADKESALESEKDEPTQVFKEDATLIHKD